MGKVWVKTRYDNDMQWDIPHSVNIATAMMGFRELGATLVPYHTIDEIYDAVSADDIVLDYIQQCVKYLQSSACIRQYLIIPR